jgi:nucleotide-binding universal stress UspA family protein
MIKRILVALDGSEHARHALNYAVESTIKWDAQLIILAVLPPVSALVYSTEFNNQYILDLENDLRVSYQRILNEAVKIVKKKGPEIKVSTKLGKGRPANVIIDTAKNENVDLIVMGSRGIGGITGWILGSTSKHVVDHCTKPILIIK